MSKEQDNINLYLRFLAAMNAPDYDALDQIFSSSFVDHHPGFDLSSLDDYKQALKTANEAVKIQAILDEILAIGNKVITRATLKGKHVGTFFGVPPTKKEVTWTTTEIWRIENGKFVERWAQDDLLGLVRQLGVSLPF
ncbi:MAG: ester cyclase [Xenococcaceae cyanobacterium MO_188.B29]|nr:ester cyclase [Xenococcaceae cyanobacterium MO_188.B29]